MTRVDSSVPLMYRDLGDLGSLILIQITPKERTPVESEELVTSRAMITRSGTQINNAWTRFDF